MAKKKTSNKKNTNINAAQKTVLLFKDERFRFVLSLFTFLFSVFIFIAFISFLFTWKTDQSKLDIDLITLIQSADIQVENWAGKIGALMAKRFINDWFGISSFSIIFLLVIIGFRFLRIRLLDLSKSIKYAIVYSIWISIAMGYFFGDAYFSLGGAHGYFMSKWLNAFIGKVGTAFFLIITLITILAFSFDNFVIWSKTLILNLVQRIFYDKKKQEDPNIPDVENKEDEVTENEKEEENESEKEGLDFEVEKSGEVEEVEIVIDESFVDDKEDSIDSKLDEYELDVEGNLETLQAKTKNNEGEVTSEQSSEETETGPELTVEKSVEENGGDESKISGEVLGPYDPTKDLSNYKFPKIDHLEKHDEENGSVTEEELISNKNKIVDTLNNYKIQIDKIKATIGPTVTLYEIVPAPGVRISKIKNLEDDIALSLAALGIRIIAPMPGKGTIGIEVPNLKPDVVSMRTIIASKKFQETDYELPLALGKTISNETFTVDLTKMPHLLVAGATGQGKSVGLNAIITSLLYKKHPSQLKFVMVDPKKVELTLYSKLERHFLAKLPDTEEPIITDTQKVVNTLNSLTIEMDQRYDLLKKAHARNIKEYNKKFIDRKLNPEKGHRFLPYIVVIIDEFADLIMTAGKEVELPIARLAQLARAIGLHLIIATQRPTTNIITGLIKANFPARLAFRVMSSIDSRTILDAPGANQLIGRGDMLISAGSDMVRIQCAFVDTPEIELITDYIGQQQGYPDALLLPEYVDEAASSIGEVDLSKRDALFDDAARIIVLNQQGSTSLIQRKFSIGYNRAGRIIDQLEAAGVVGPFEGSKARQVLIPDEYSLEQLLNNL
jgi:DNA segregation ATPase FtsK/SpoIIIE, S-DNA-T family